MLDERFDEMMQQANPPFTGATPDYGDYFLSKTKQAFCVTVLTKPDGIETGLQAALTEIERMKRYGFTASEYERARANYLQRLESAYMSSYRVGSVISISKSTTSLILTASPC